MSRLSHIWESLTHLNSTHFLAHLRKCEKYLTFTNITHLQKSHIYKNHTFESLADILESFSHTLESLCHIFVSLMFERLNSDCDRWCRHPRDTHTHRHSHAHIEREFEQSFFEFRNYPNVYLSKTTNLRLTHTTS